MPRVDRAGAGRCTRERSAGGGRRRTAISTVHDMMVAGYDRLGFDMSAALRRRLGDDGMRAALGRYGLGTAPGHLELSRDDEA